MHLNLNTVRQSVTIDFFLLLTSDKSSKLKSQLRANKSEIYIPPLTLTRLAEPGRHCSAHTRGPEL